MSALTKKAAGKAAKATAKQKPVAYVNWAIKDENGDPILKSNRGFSLFDNEYLTLEEKALIQLATDNGGSASVVAELKVIVAQEKPDSLDISKIRLVA